MTYIKNLAIISLIFGAISGFLALVPIFGIIILLMLIFCSSFIIIVFMKRFALIPNPNEQTGMLWGGISGFLTFIGFSTMVMLVIFLAILCGMMNAFAGLASVYFFNNSQSAVLPPKDTKFSLNMKKRK